MRKYNTLGNLTDEQKTEIQDAAWNGIEKKINGSAGVYRADSLFGMVATELDEVPVTRIGEPVLTADEQAAFANPTQRAYRAVARGINTAYSGLSGLCARLKPKEVVVDNTAGTAKAYGK